MEKPLTDVDFQALEARFPAKYGKPGIARVDTSDLGSFVFKRPDRRQHAIYMKHMAEKQIAEACEFLSMATVVHPSREEFEQMIECLPGLPTRFASTFAFLAGTSQAIEGEA